MTTFDQTPPPGSGDDAPLQEALAWLMGELEPDAASAFEARLLAEPGLRELIEELRALTGTDTARADLLAPSRDLLPGLRERVGKEQATEAAFTAAVRDAAGETGVPGLPVLDGTPDAATLDAVHAIFHALADADLAPERDLLPSLRERLTAERAAEAAFTRAVRDAAGETDTPGLRPLDVDDSPDALSAAADIAAIFAATANPELLAPSRDLLPGLRERHTAINAEEAAWRHTVSEAVGEAGSNGDAAAPALPGPVAAAARNVLTAAANTPELAPSQDLYPAVRDQARPPARIRSLLPVLAIGTGLAAAALLVALLIGPLGDLNAPVVETDDDVDRPDDPPRNGPSRVPDEHRPEFEVVSEPGNGNDPVHTHPDVTPPDERNYWPVEREPVLPRYDDVRMHTQPASIPIDPLHGSGEYLFTTCHPHTVIDVPFEVPTDLHQTVLAPGEWSAWLPLPTRHNPVQLHRQPAIARLGLDYDGDGTVDDELDAGGERMFALKSDSGGVLPYRVRFDYNDRSGEWRALPLCVMVTHDRVAGRTTVFLDGNFNGRFNDSGVDMLGFAGEDPACLLTPVVRVGDDLFDLALAESGTAAAFARYTGPTGRLAVDTRFRLGVDVDVLRLRSPLCAVVLTTRDLRSEIVVPRGTYTLSSGRVSDGEGFLAIGNVGELGLHPTGVIASSHFTQPSGLFAPIPDDAVSVEVHAGQRTDLTLGGPLRLVAEIDPLDGPDGRLHLTSEDVALVGVAGERYTGRPVVPEAVLMVSAVRPWEQPIEWDISVSPPVISQPTPKFGRLTLQLVERELSRFLTDEDVYITVALKSGH